MPRSSSRRAQPKAEEVDQAKFVIDPLWFEQEGRSFAAVVNARRCPSCQAALVTEKDSRDPMRAVVECCSGKPTYLNKDLPVLEAAFRAILAGGNQPASALAIRERLSDAGLDLGARYVSQERLERILSGDTFYGIKRLEPPQPEHQAVA